MKLDDFIQKIVERFPFQSIVSLYPDDYNKVFELMGGIPIPIERPAKIIDGNSLNGLTLPYIEKRHILWLDTTARKRTNQQLADIHLELFHNNISFGIFDNKINEIYNDTHLRLLASDLYLLCSIPFIYTYRREYRLRMFKMDFYYNLRPKDLRNLLIICDEEALPL